MTFHNPYKKAEQFEIFQGFYPDWLPTGQYHPLVTRCAMIQGTHHFQQHLKHSYHNIQVNNEQDTTRKLEAAPCLKPMEVDIMAD